MFNIIRIFRTHNSELRVILSASLLLITILKSFLSFHMVKGESMVPIVLEKRWIISYKFAYGVRLNNNKRYLFLWNTPQKNDIVIIKDPLTKKIVVKKIFAIPNEKFKKLQNNKITIDNIDFKIDKTFLKKNSKEIPKNCYLVIGENKTISIDSRSYGFININNILGKIIYCF